MNNRPTIGQTVIETLTLGMYENPLIIYREYVQNAADAIDEAVELRILSRKSDGEINITIEKENRKIIIQDNATGISAKNALNFLGDVANSQKNSIKNKGFRGIGRLGGMGYCEQLIFETSAINEKIKTIITLDASRLKKIIENAADTRDAASVMSVITDLVKVEEVQDTHYFKVILQGVSNEKLLISEDVKDYLSMVAPLPFLEEFLFKKKIEEEFKKRNFILDEYHVKLIINQTRLFKPYRNILSTKMRNLTVKIIDIEVFDLEDINEEIIGIGWFSVTNISNYKIDSQYVERSLRLRYKNIQIGDDNTLKRFFFSGSRFVENYIGEVHAISPNFKPNARRDYFNDSALVTQFEKELSKVLKELNDLTYVSSDLHSYTTKVKKYQEDKEKFENEVFGNEKQEVKRKEELLIKYNEAKLAETKAKKILVGSKNELAGKIFKAKSKDLLLDIKPVSKKIKRNYPEPNLPKLTPEEKKVALSIFEVIRDNLEKIQAEKLIKKIIEKYSD